MSNEKTLIEKIQKLEPTYERLNDILSVVMRSEDISYALDICSWIRAEAKKLRTPEALDLIKRTYIFGGRHSFDQYMIACEWNREPQARFWIPRRSVLESKHKIASQIQEFIDDPESLYLGFSLPPGTGKAQPLYSKVLTPNGFVEMGTLRIGDEIIAGNGNISRISGIYPQGEKDVYKVTFNDGASTECCKEHLWYAQSRDDRDSKRFGIGGRYRTFQLLDMMKNFKVENGKRLNYSIDYISPIQYEKRELLLHPYIIGALIGDGYICGKSIKLCNGEKEVLDKFRTHLPEDDTIKHISGVDYRIIKKDKSIYSGGKPGSPAKTSIRKALEYYGLYGCKSESKFIPKDYLLSSVKDRLELLRGLFDTDGHAGCDYIEYTTVSPCLKDDIMDLVRSLGGYVTVTAKQGKYKKDGNIFHCKTAYRMLVQFPKSDIDYFHLYRKKVMYNPKRKEIKRYIKNIEYVGKRECQCIMIDDPCHLYITDDYIITHNTTLIKFLLAYIAGKYPDSQNMYVSYSDSLVKMILDAETSILTDTDEYLHNDIFSNGSPHISAEYKTITYRKRGDFPTIGLVPLGGSVTGRTRANKFLITDDLVKNAEEARSPERLNKLYEDYRTTLTTRMIGNSVKQIQLGTIWSCHDPISRMKREHEDDPRYKFIAIPVWEEDTEISNFEYNHPDNYTIGKIKDIIKNIDPVDFSCLYMQKGIEKEGLAFASDMLRYYNGVLPDGEPDNILFVCDVAWGGGDFLSMPVCYQYGNDGYIHDVVFDKGDKFMTKPRVVGKILQHKIKMGRFEANNGGDEYCDDVSRELKQSHKYSINLTHKKAPSNMSKLSRIEQHAPEIRNLYFRDTTCRDEDYRKFMNNLTSFSFTSKNLNDDAPDSCSMLIDYMTSRIKMVTVAKRLF